MRVTTAGFRAGCFISGLYLEGAEWDTEKGCLVRSRPKVLLAQLPILKVIPAQSRHLSLQVVTAFFFFETPFFSAFLQNASPAFRFVLQNTLRTPVYTTSQRRNAMGVGLVFEADLFTTKHISHWVIQGVCLCLNAD